MSTVFTGSIFNSLKETIDEIVDDSSDGYEAASKMPEVFDVQTMSDYYVDDLEMGGPGLASEIGEGTEIVAGTLQEGILTRYISRKFGLKLIITEEAMEDNKYDQVIDAARRLKRSAVQTREFDGANVLVRAANSAYVGGDGVSLASTSHTLPDGGTFSNTMAVTMSPSRMALITATTQIMKFPGHNGLPTVYKGKKIVSPVDQWAAWAGVLKSGQVPESNANEINVVKTDLDMVNVPWVYWNTTTTNWAILTDADNGLVWKDRRKMRSRTWVENDNETAKHAITYRSARGWSDARGVLFNNG